MTALVVLRMAAGLAEIPSLLRDEIGMGAATALTVSGAILHAYLPRLRMTAEEDAKDRKLSSDAAQQRIAFYRRCASFTTLTGVLVLVFVLIDLVR